MKNAGIIIAASAIIFSCTKDDSFISNTSSSSNTEQVEKISDPYELLKKGDYELFKQLETKKDDYVNFVPGLVLPDDINSGGNISPINCYRGSLCYIIVEADQNSKGSSNSHVMMYQQDNGQIKRFKGNTVDLEVIDNEIVSGEFIINEEY